MNNLVVTDDGDSLYDNILRIQIKDAILPPNDRYRLVGGIGIFRNNELMITGNIDPMIERLLNLVKKLLKEQHDGYPKT